MQSCFTGRRRFLAVSADSLAWSAFSAGDIAEDRPISLIVSYPAGAGADAFSSA